MRRFAFIRTTTPVLLVLVACSSSSDGKSPEATLSACPAPPNGVAGANFAFVVASNPVQCTALQGVLQRQGTAENLVGSPTNAQYNVRAQIRVTSAGPIAVGAKIVATRDVNNAVANPVMDVPIGGGNACGAAGTLVVEAYTLNGKSGTISGTLTGDVDANCNSPENPTAITPVKGKFENVPFTVLP